MKRNVMKGNKKDKGNATTVNKNAKQPKVMKKPSGQMMKKPSGQILKKPSGQINAPMKYYSELRRDPDYWKEFDLRWRAKDVH